MDIQNTPFNSNRIYIYPSWQTIPATWGTPPQINQMQATEASDTVAQNFLAPQRQPQVPQWCSLPSNLVASQQSTLQRLAAFTQELMQWSEFVGQQAELNRSNGIGMQQGIADLNKLREAEQYMQLVSQLLDGGRRAAAAQTNQSETAGQIGSLGQNYLIDQLQGEAWAYLLNQCGVNSPQLSATQAADALINSISTQNATAAVGAEAAAGEATSAANSPLSGAGKIIGAAGAAYSAYQLINNWGNNSPVGGAMQGATAGAYIGSIIPGVGTLIGGIVGGIAGALIGCIKSGKHKDQVARDALRDHLAKLGVIDDNHNVLLANGDTYNIGIDGSNRWLNLDGTKRRPYNVDSSNPLTPEVIGWVAPMTAALTGGNQKLKDDLTGYLVNAALSNTDSYEGARQNVLAILARMNIAPTDLVQGLYALAQEGKLSETEFAAYQHGLSTLLAGTISTGVATADIPPIAGLTHSDGMA